MTAQLLSEINQTLLAIDVTDIKHCGGELDALANTVNLMRRTHRELAAASAAAAAVLMPPPPPRSPPMMICTGFEDKNILYAGKNFFVGGPLIKNSLIGNNIVGCNEFLCHGSCKRVTFVSTNTLNELFSGAPDGRKKYGNALLKTRRYCPIWIESHNLDYHDKNVAQLPTPEELKAMNCDFNYEVAQEKLRKGQWSVTFTDPEPIGLRLKFDYAAGFLTGVTVNHSEGLPVLIEGGQMIELIEEEVLSGAKLLNVNDKFVVGETKESIMALLKEKRPITLAFQIIPEKVPSEILKSSGAPEGGVPSRIWSDMAANKQLALLTVAAGTAEDAEASKRQRIE